MQAATEERREWLRIDDRLLLEYHLVDEAPDSSCSAIPPVTEDAIRAAIAKPTTDLLSQGGDAIADSPLLPWIRKVDWLLEILLRGMAKTHPGSISCAQVADVNVSGGGISFATPRQFEVGAVLALKLILPPFTSIEAQAEIIRVTPDTRSPGSFTVATQFIDLRADYQELLIRHVLQTQAERLRTRRSLSR